MNFDKDKTKRVLNLSVRVVTNLVFFSFYPTFLVVIYLYNQKIFPYDLFTNGLFGARVFVYTALITSLLLAFFIWAVVRQVQFLITEFKEKKFKKASKSVFKTLLGLFLLFILFQNDFSLFLFISIPPLLLGFLTIQAFKQDLKNYLYLSAFIYLALLIMPIAFNDQTTKHIAIGLAGFGSGGGIDASIVNQDDEVIEGKLVILSPESIYLQHNKSTNIYDRSHLKKITILAKKEAEEKPQEPVCNCEEETAKEKPNKSVDTTAVSAPR